MEINHQLLFILLGQWKNSNFLEKKACFCGKFVNFQANFVEKGLVKKSQSHGNLLIIFHGKAFDFALVSQTFFTKKDGNFPIFRKWWRVHVVAPATETSTSCKCCLCKTSDTAGKLEHLVWTIVHVCICLTARFFLTAIIICFWPQLVPSFSQLLH